MATRESVPTRSQRLRLGVFRAFGVILFVLGLLAMVSLAVFAYFIVTDSQDSVWFSLLLLAGGALISGLLMAVGRRVQRIDSMEEFQKQSHSKWLDIG